ncbi:MFS transporter [Streptomyces spiroverticillatus]|uniref:MFS transporter n=1 Tax=Streptomyces finlayi TaxID=67296 RepID=A0A919CDD2_9ACTN|nr:MFS transporter [Streptomyces finlayi]GHA32373.1 MFS transporter [Streptomyces spiroverticillatus]GHD10623.1 MFS transporter [Streptomyces finlayi]
MSAKPSYGAVLRTPQAARTFGSALLGRLAYGILPLPLVLTVKNATGSYAAAGVLMSVYGACSVLLSPYRAGLVDRFGPRRALLPLAAVFAAFLVTLALVCWTPGAPVPLIGLLVALVGVSCPPLGPTMRVLWGRLVPDRALLQRAYSLDGVVEELLFVAGPLIVGIPVVYARPATGILAAAVLVLVGTTAMVTFPVAAQAEAKGKSPKGAKGPRVPGLALPAAVAAATGLSLGGVGLLGIAFTEAHGHPEAISWVEAALVAGSAVGGLVYGAVNWRSGGRSRLLTIACLLGCALAAAGLAPGVFVLVPAVMVVGLFIAPAITTAYLIADEAAGPDSRARAGAWVNTALNAGSSVGAAAVGVLVGHIPLTLSYLLVALPVLATAAVGFVLRGRGRRAQSSSESAPSSPPVALSSS